jgi:hypothetical protein
VPVKGGIGKYSTSPGSCSHIGGRGLGRQIPGRARAVSVIGHRLEALLQHRFNQTRKDPPGVNRRPQRSIPRSFTSGSPPLVKTTLPQCSRRERGCARVRDRSSTELRSAKAGSRDPLSTRGRTVNSCARGAALNVSGNAAVPKWTRLAKGEYHGELSIP